MIDIIGVDVGLTGAIAQIEDTGTFIRVDDLPVMEHGRAKWIDAQKLAALMGDFIQARAYVEHIHAMPKLGTVAANSKGMTMGSVLATLQIAKIGIELVPPQTWKRALGLLDPNASDRERKHASLCRARLLFPQAPLEREKDHGRAEALLIAHWAQTTLYRKAKP